MSTISTTRALVVRCSGEGHRVRLAWRRFWASATCPRCRARVDPTRLLRIRAGLATFAVPRSPSAVHRGLVWVVLGYTGLILVSGLALWGLSDRWWPATALLFGPRWTLLLPLGVLVPMAAYLDRYQLIPLALAAVVGLGAVMGLRTGWRAVFSFADRERDVRVVTFNAMGGRTIDRPVTEMLLDWDADIAAFQECGVLAERLALLSDWHTTSGEGLCLVSRFPILETMRMDREGIAFAGGAGHVHTSRIAIDGQPVLFTNLHLETPRAGFEQLRAGEVDEGARLTEQKSSLREIELRRARRWVDQFEGPSIVVGDFNTPPESAIYRASWSTYRNAFSTHGRGFGATRDNGWIRARIDHILVNDGWRVVSAFVGDDLGSDHRPMLADVRLRP